MDPTPVGVESDGGGLGGAAACSTLLPGKRGVVLGSAGADLLPEHGRNEGKEDKRGRYHRWKAQRGLVEEKITWLCCRFIPLEDG